ncbi:DNA starvation/stationary phase protection protein [Candidatus Gracilibacteria bacterium]|nr:MAG: DNA starvation/stationary phase protection protein [Candidatus Gracilibacteria bacterium]
MKKVDIGIKGSKKLISLLEVLLASENVANLKTRKYHRNVESKRFRGLHEYFEELYSASFERIDELAERIRILGAYTKGTFKEYLELSLVKEDEDNEVSETKMLENIVEDKLIILKALKDAIEEADDIDDIGTEGLLSGFLESYEKDLWMLRSMMK